MNPPTKLRSLLSRVALLLFAVAVAGAFYLNLCDLVFDCGCRSWWSGAAQMCNINDGSTHNCPWCSHGTVLGYLPLALVIAGQAAVVFWPRRLSLARRAFLALATFPVLGILIAVVYGILGGYWA